MKMILITRPQVDALTTQQALAAKGISAITLPMVKISDDNEAYSKVRTAIDEYEYLLITSYNTIRFLQKHQDIWNKLASKKLLVVGQKSALALPHTTAVAENSATLFKILAQPLLIK